MLITLDQADSKFQIQTYTKGEVKINDKLYQTSLVITPTQIIADWGPSSTDELTTEHLQVVLDTKPEIIILGTGDTQDFSIIKKLPKTNIGVEIMTTAAACRTYMILLAERRKVTTALIF